MNKAQTLGTLGILGQFKTFKEYIKIKGHNDRYFDPLQIQSFKNKNIYLTFDTCPTHEVDYDTINWLNENKIPHTIFLNITWYNNNKNKDLSFLKSPLCTIGGHGFEYKRSLNLNYVEQYEDISKCKDFIKAELGVDIKYWRSPWGKPNENTHKILSKLGMKFISWSGYIFDKDSDGEISDNDIKQSMDYVQNNIKGGEILIFHINGEGMKTLKSLKRVYSYLKEKFTFAKL